MANSQLLVLACLAVLAACAVAAPAAGCTIRAENQSGTLKEQIPKNCLNSKKVQDAITSIVPTTCFTNVKMNVTNSTGADCAMPGTFFNVSFATTNDACLPGNDIGGGEMTATPGGGSSVAGKFITDTAFTGSATPAGLFTVTVAGMDCQLVYATKIVGKPNITTTEATAAAANATEAPAAAAADNATAAAAPKKSSATAATPAALMALLAGVVALAF
uniref:Uncharacterized protein n=1 Tax=Tetradesmus obliquus TaxID=3088 RepID=A0A383VSZ5_TETOB|eukprot:jgi/Sobl393_1/13403/SZX68301.1